MEQRVSLARSAAIQFLDGLRKDDMAAIYHFSDKTSLVQDFSNSRDIYEAIFDLKADGQTLLYDSIYKAAEELGNRVEKRKAIVVLSDGADTRSKRSAEKVLKAALSVNAAIYTVDMTNPEAKIRDRMDNQRILQNFAMKSGGRYVAAMGGIALRESFKNIAAELGKQFTFVFEPDEKMLDGKWHKIEVKIDNPELVVRTREGFNAQKSK
jgi:VWFA-related protein